jgi:hypothetical protein
MWSVACIIAEMIQRSCFFCFFPCNFLMGGCGHAICHPHYRRNDPEVMCVRARVRACVRVCVCIYIYTSVVCVCVCVCVCVNIFIYI